MPEIKILPRSEALKRFEDAARRRQEILDNPEISEADWGRANAFSDEIDVYKKSLTHWDAVDAAKSASMADLKYLNEPVRTLPHLDQVGGGARVAGSVSSGAATVRHDSAGNMKTVADFGAGIYTERQLAAINDPIYATAWMKHLRGGAYAMDQMSPSERKTLSEGLDPQGGFVSPPTMLPGIVQRKPTPTQLCGRVSRANSASSMAQIAAVNYEGNATDDPNAYIYTTGIRATSVGELPVNDPMQINDAQMWGLKNVQVFTFMLDALISKNQLEDASFDFQAWIAEKFGETITLLQDNMILNGNGITQPDGILNGATYPSASHRIPTMLSGVAGALTADNVYEQSTDLPEQYDENAAFVLKKTSTYKQLRLLKDTQNHYLFGQGYQDSGFSPGRPKEMGGYPMLWSQFMPDPSATAYPLLFGDLKGYYQIDRVGFSLQVQNELYARQNMVGLVGRIRFGGRVLEPWRMRLMKSNNS